MRISHHCGFAGTSQTTTPAYCESHLAAQCEGHRRFDFHSDNAACKRIPIVLASGALRFSADTLKVIEIDPILIAVNPASFSFGAILEL